MHRLISRSRPFFAPGAAEEIMNEIRPMMYPHDTIIFRAAGVLALFLPTNTDFKVEWISEILAYWSWIGTHTVDMEKEIRNYSRAFHIFSSFLHINILMTT